MQAKVSGLRELVVAWIDRILRQRNWTATELARQAQIAPSTILRLLNNPGHTFDPSMSTLGKISAASGTPIPRKIVDAVGIRASVERTRSRSRQHKEDRAARTVEVRQFSSLPAVVRTSPQMATKVRIPDQLKLDPTIFAFYMFNDDLDPVLKSGSLVFATRRRDPIKGDTLLISDRAGRSRVRFLIDMSEKGLMLSRSLPMREEECLPFDEVQELAIVVGTILAI
jgi:transcriptional regulator with XRE-family HTH domain